MPGKIFVNYRRDDSAAHALNVAQYLERTFGASNVFLDIDRMRAGQNFPDVLNDKLSACKVMIAVIGPSWVTLTNDDGQRRLDDPEDWVRLEIAHALKRNIAVIPILVGGAVLPKKSDLPDDLKPLLQRHVATITTNGFRNEMAGLVRDIRVIQQGLPWGKVSAALLAIVLLTLAAKHWTQQSAPSLWFPLMTHRDTDSSAAKTAAEERKRIEIEAQRQTLEAERERLKAEAEENHRVNLETQRREFEADRKRLTQQNQAEKETREQAELETQRLKDAGEQRVKSTDSYTGPTWQATECSRQADELRLHDAERKRFRASCKAKLSK